MKVSYNLGVTFVLTAVMLASLIPSPTANALTDKDVVYQEINPANSTRFTLDIRKSHCASIKFWISPRETVGLRIRLPGNMEKINIYVTNNSSYSIRVALFSPINVHMVDEASIGPGKSGYLRYNMWPRLPFEDDWTLAISPHGYGRNENATAEVYASCR